MAAMLKKLLAVSAGLLFALTVFAATVQWVEGHPDRYIVQKGDTLFKIARAKYGDASAVRKIKEANPGLDADHIKVGQKINLP